MRFFLGLIFATPISIALWLMIAIAAFAEESPQVRALNLRIGAEVNANLQCSTAAFTLQDQLASIQAEVKRLTDKYEPKQPEKDK